MEGDTGHVLAHALIQRQNGTEWIAQGEISPQRDAICTIAKVDDFIPLNDSGSFDALVCSLIFISQLSYYATFKVNLGYTCT